MKLLSEYTTPPGFTLLQLGASGVGKSHRALHIALRYGPVMVLDYDKNISRMYEKLQAKNALDKVMLCDEADMYSFEKLERYLRLEAKKPKLDYATIIVDTATFLNSAMHEELTKHSYFGDSKNVLKMFGELGTRMTKIQELIASLPVNFIMNAHEKFNEGGQAEIVGHGKSSDMWSKRFGEKHRLMTRPKSLIPRVKAAMSDGLVTSYTDRLDADGFFKDDQANDMFDNIAYKF
jgi:hypothetical protein